MIILAVDSIGTAPPGKEKTVVGCSLGIEQIGSSIANIEFRIAPSQGSFLIFLVFGTDILAIPEVVLLIPFFIGIIVSQRCLNLFPGCSLLGVC